VTATSYIDLTAVNGTTYYYAVSAATSISEAGETANSPQEANATLGTPPPAPTASYNSPVYAGMTLHLSATTITGATYNWTGPNSFASTSQNPSIINAGQNASGNYSVTATVGGYTSVAGTTAVTVNPPVAFTVQSFAGNLILNWPYGVLQSTTNLSGSWSNVGGAASPYTNAPIKTEEFFRLKLQ
jgi:hypothetical protein